MKAKNEGEALAHMELWAQRGKLSGAHPLWTKRKHQALDLMLDDWATVHQRPLELVDIGIGDADHVLTWPRFWEVRYTGIDGAAGIVRRAVDLGLEAHHLTIGDLVAGGLLHTSFPFRDAIMVMDVLYHIPEQGLHDALLHEVFTAAKRYVLLSHATDPRQVFGGARGPGQPGYCWFPRPFAGPPAGWREIHRMDADTLQKQRLLVFKREAY